MTLVKPRLTVIDTDPGIDDAIGILLTLASPKNIHACLFFWAVSVTPVTIGPRNSGVTDRKIRVYIHAGPSVSRRNWSVSPTCIT